MQIEQDSNAQNYQIWKKNCTFMYDRLVVTKLSLPSISFNWLNYKQQTNDTVTYKYSYSTNSSHTNQDEYLYFAKMEFPKLKRFNQQQISHIPKNIITSKIKHPGQPNRIIRHPVNYLQVATKTVRGSINIYRQGCQAPIQILNGHTLQGYGLDWKQQGLVSGSYDGLVFAWKNVYSISGLPDFSRIYSDKIQDIKWFDQNVFLAVSDDGFMSIWDIRANNSVVRYKWNDQQINTLDINSFQKQLVVTGTNNGIIKLWDLRRPTNQLYPFYNHTDSVIRVQWSPHFPNVFASGSVDSKINIWDIFNLGAEVSLHETKQQFNQLIFSHKGQRGRISDLNWNPYQPLIGSVEQQYNTLHFFQIPYLSKQNQNQDWNYQKDQILV